MRKRFLGLFLGLGLMWMASKSFNLPAPVTTTVLGGSSTATGPDRDFAYFSSIVRESVEWTLAVLGVALAVWFGARIASEVWERLTDH